MPVCRKASNFLIGFTWWRKLHYRKFTTTKRGFISAPFEFLLLTCHSPAPRRRRCLGWPLCRPHYWRSGRHRCPRYSCQPRCSWIEKIVQWMSGWHWQSWPLTWTCSRWRCWCPPRRRSGRQWCPRGCCMSHCPSPSLKLGKWIFKT